VSRLVVAPCRAEVDEATRALPEVRWRRCERRGAAQLRGRQPGEVDQVARRGRQPARGVRGIGRPWLSAEGRHAPFTDVVPERAPGRNGPAATPVAPAPRDAGDPDLWYWGEDDDSRPRRHPWRAVLAAVLVLSLVLLLLISVLWRGGRAAGGRCCWRAPGGNRTVLWSRLSPSPAP